MATLPDTVTNRKAALDNLRFKKRIQADKINSHVSSASSSTTSLHLEQMGLHTPPAQSRDATLPSRFFPPTPSSSGTILVPSSSPPPSDPAYLFHTTGKSPERGSPVPPGLIPSESWGSTGRSLAQDELSLPSGFVTKQDVFNASFSRPWNGSTNRVIAQDIRRGEPPRKRINRGDSPGDPIDLFAVPHSPEVQLPGQRRRLHASIVLSSASDEDTVPDGSRISGPSKPRIIRGHHSPQASESTVLPSDSSPNDEGRFVKFNFTQPMHSENLVRAAWNQAGGVEIKAEALLNDPAWRLQASGLLQSPRKSSEMPSEVGRVKELDEATKAERARVREMGKKSIIYRNNHAAKPTSRISTPPPSQPVLESTKSSPVQILSSPEIIRKAKRPKRKVIESDSDGGDYLSSDDDKRSSSSSQEVELNRVQALSYLNTASLEALQELTGCTEEQASIIIAKRPFDTTTELCEKLGQGRKKAGPSGISPRLFEDCAEIFKGYGKVDSILDKCERIGATLRTEIATWTTSLSDKGKSVGKASPTPADGIEDGAVSISSKAGLASKKPDYFISNQPQSLSSSTILKEYQLLGVNWLNLLWLKKYSCILADEMGLGKTVQVISFFAHLKDRGSKGPHLVVVPSSTLENWLREFNRFAPSINVSAYYANKNERGTIRATLRDTQARRYPGGWEVLVTTYNLAQGDDMDRKFFRHIDWEACVFDEGHVLKNFQSQRYQALLRFSSRWRLLLTGTPLQNNLQELVSLMNFIMPQQFGNELESLRAVFKAKGDSKVTLLAQERTSRAKKMLTPFVLRRRKDQVLQDLPKKTERIEWCEMTKSQKSIYHDALQRSRKTVFDLEGNEVEESSASKGKQVKKGKGNARTKEKLYLENSSNVLMDLRKAALHPMLFRRLYSDSTLTSMAKLLLKEPDFKKRGAIFDYVKEDMEVMTDAELQVFCATYKSTRKFLQEDDCYLQAGKIKVLMKLLEQYQKDGRRVLIFSQFTQVLDILQKVLDKRKIRYLLLTGSTPVDVRQTLVDEFTEDESIPIFLLSTKAGGMGINLTAASVVIMFDQDFNPHNDKQAQDRAYRIGQKRDVDVIKLITKDSIEEDMLQLGMTKLALDDAVSGNADGEKIEQEIKTSLMNVVRRKLQGKEESDLSELEDVMDVDEP